MLTEEELAKLKKELMEELPVNEDGQKVLFSGWNAWGRSEKVYV